VVAEKSEQRVEGRGRTLAPGQATDAEIEALDALDEPAGLIAAEDDDTRDEMTIELRSDAAAGDAGARRAPGREDGERTPAAWEPWLLHRSGKAGLSRPSACARLVPGKHRPERANWRAVE
jgi:hypothetical protein